MSIENYIPLDLARQINTIPLMEHNIGKKQGWSWPFSQIRDKGFNVLRENSKISNVFMLLCANFFNNAVTFFTNILVANKVGPESFGIFSLAVSIMMMVNFIFDMGLNLALVRFFNIYQKDEEYQKTVLLSLLLVRFAILGLLIVSAFFVSPTLMTLLHLAPVHKTLILISIVTGGILTLWVYFQSYMQAHKRFTKLASYLFGYGVLRILFLVIFFAISPVVPNLGGLLSYLYTAPVSVVALLGIIPIMVYMYSRRLPSLWAVLKPLKEIMKYSKWVALSSISYSLVLRAIQFVLALRTSKYELGILSAGFVFTLAFSTLNMAIRAVFFPHVTSFEKKTEMKSYYLRIKKMGPYYMGFAVVGILILTFLQISLLGKEYVTALPVFLITSAALAITVFLGLWSMMVHTLMHPEIDAAVNISRLVVACLIVYFVSPNLGAIGGALAYAIPLLLGEIFMVLYVRKAIIE